MKSHPLAHFSLLNLVRLMIVIGLTTQSLLMAPSFSRAAEAAIPNAANSIAKEAAARAIVDANYGKLPLSFEANRGQADKQVKFLARTGGASLLLKNDEAVLTLSREEKTANKSAKKAIPSIEESPRRITATVKMKLLNANPNPRIVGLDEQQAKSSYFSGSDPKQWTTDVPNYAKVKYESIYPGIDLIFYGNPQKLEYDFVVAPGADPKQIKLNFAGAQKMRVDAGGDLVLQTKAGEVRQHEPVMYQEANGERREIVGKYLLSGNQIGFEVGAYDASKPLVIDPIIAYATFFGPEACRGLDVDGAGNAYVLSEVPRTQGAFQGGGSTFSVTKLNAAGTAVIYSATFGGHQDDRANDIAVDAAGNAYIVGRAKSPNFPTTPGAFQASFGSSSEQSYNGFVTKLNAAGDGLVYSTFLKGETFPQGAFGKLTIVNAIALDPQGNAYVTGYTITPDFPVTPGAYQTNPAPSQYRPQAPILEAFVTKLNPTGTALVFSTYLGSASSDVGTSIAVDVAGNTYVTGYTGNGFIDIRLPLDTPFPITPGAYRTTDTYGTDSGLSPDYVFVSKFNPSGTALVYSTLLGTNNGNVVSPCIAVDASGNAFVSSTTVSATFPTTPGAYQTVGGGTDTARNLDVFVSKLNPTGTSLIYSTFLGGNSGEDAHGIAVDAEGNAWVTGLTASSDFPQIGLPPQTIGNGSDYGAFVTKLNATGSKLLFSVFLRQAQPGERSNSLALDATGNAYVTGVAFREFVPTPGVYQSTLGGGFVAKVTPPRTVVSVSAASYVGTTLASESIVTAFGTGLATATQVATSTPLPTTLAGTTVKVRDSSGVERPAPLFFVSPTQINYLMPQGTANGAATVTVTSAKSEISLAGAQIANVAPGLFTANASGQGIAAAVALRIKADGTQIFEPVAQFDPAQSQLVALPIDLGSESDQVFLILYGTGIRFRSGLGNVVAKFGGTDAQVSFAGPQGDFVGLDQVNIRLPRSLAGRDDVDVVLTVDGKTANTVKVKIK